ASQGKIRRKRKNCTENRERFYAGRAILAGIDCADIRGAWIEIREVEQHILKIAVAPLTGCVN
ncbi:MAG: hypothetical protein RR580_06570, partial [Christensenellaceae bacterium]